MGPMLPLAVTPATTPTRTVRAAPRPELARPWRLVLLDDDDHTYEYVLEMLAHVFGYARDKAFALARIVDTEGRVTLMTAGREACEAKQAQVHAYGADPRIPRCQGSMSAIVEQTDAP